jgi:hydrophobe/amphiphile efflux-1 (HAE1) family protein
LQQKLSQINGVGQVVVGGSSLPAVRVELNPTVLNKYGIDLEDVRKTLVEANVTQPKGQLTDGIRTSAIITNDQIFRAYEYQPLVIKYSNGAAIKMSDVAVVNDSVEDLRNAGMANGETSVLLVIFKQPGANVIGTVDRVRQMMPLLKASIPAAITMNIIMDRTTTIRASLFDVEMTLLMAMFLVIFVIYVFLKNVRSALIPSVTVPLSLLGTFCMMYLFGYTLDNLSLMALTIVTGFVVDDAVVVLENITRHIEAGMKPKEAALQGAQEVGFTVLSMSASLIAVFIPILLMTGIVGRLFREFAMTLSIAIFVSLIISLTVTPMMCAWLLKAETREHGKSARVTFTKRMQNGYEHSLSWVLDHQPLMLVVTIATIMINVGLFWVVPKGFFPQQDTGRISASIQAQQDISFQAMKQKLTSFVKIVGEDEAVENVSGFVGSGGGGGGSTTNAGSMYISLKPLAERGVMADTVINRLREKLVVPGATLYMQSAQDLVIGGRQGNAQFQYTLSAYNLEDLNIWVPRIMEQLAKLPGIADLNSDQLNHGLQVFLTVDRDTAARFGLTAQQIDNVLYDAFGQRQVSTMYSAMNQYHVVMEVEPRYWQRPETLNDIYMASSTGQRVPLSAFTHFTPSSTLLMVNHQNQFPSVTLSFNLLPGVALGDAVAMISNKINEMHLPPATLHGAFQGAAQAFQASLASQAYLIMATLIAVYIVLGILYESLIHPLTILSTLPSAGVGALLALQLTGTELSLIALIGIILLIGIVKKNAIMMIDFALHVERTEKKSPREAIYEACCLRFRPIMMTTMAALLSAFPLAFSHGVGSELRRPLGISIVGGLIVSQVLTLYTTPVIYLTLENYSQWCRQHWVRLVLRLKMTRSVQNS